MNYFFKNIDFCKRICNYTQNIWNICIYRIDNLLCKGFLMEKVDASRSFFSVLIVLCRGLSPLWIDLDRVE